MRYPTPHELRHIRQRVGLTRKQAAALVHRSWQCWKVWETPDNPICVDMGLFELFLIKVGDDEALAQWFPEDKTKPA